MSTAEPIRFLPPETPEDHARADFYALIATLFYAPPSGDLLDALAGADEIHGEDDSVPLAAAWTTLQAACAATDEEAVQQEYDDLLVGVGKAVVPPYIAAHAEKTGVEALLVELKAFLAARGLGRQASVSEPEDHVAALCEVMRHLIAVERAEIGEQREFFERFMLPGVARLCASIEAASEANFYKRVAAFAAAFFELERKAFEME
jgi:TorA maturation chaperone TorD